MKVKLIVKSTVLFLGLVVLFIAFATYSYINGVPFVEGTTIITTGGGYGFKIGASKEECFKALKRKYDEKDYNLRTFWDIDAPESEALEIYPNVKLKRSVLGDFYDHDEWINNIETMTPPMKVAKRWDIEIPARWVNDIHLEFKKDKLVEIIKNRWLVERP